MKEGVQRRHFRGTRQDCPEGVGGGTLSFLPDLVRRVPLLPFAVDWVRDLARFTKLTC